MSISRVVVGLTFVAVLLAGCAKPPNSTQLTAQTEAASSAKLAYISETNEKLSLPNRLFAATSLTGRTLAVASADEIILKPGEVVLTFDDGPRPGKTASILDTLDAYGVKASFLMLGQSAEAHPALAQEVAARGHTVGSHTYRHVDLSKLTSQEAMAEVLRGERAVQAALSPAGEKLSPFFRFPYLAQTGFLRTNLTQSSMVVLDVHIDSKDYYKESAAVVAARTLNRLDAQGKGIVLFHDIHQRTVDMLPDFLAELQKRGYSVVRLVPKANGVFGRDLITAKASDGQEAL